MTTGKMLLLVEDEALVRHDLNVNLGEAGFDVKNFSDGERALRAFETDLTHLNSTPAPGCHQPVSFELWRAASGARGRVTIGVGLSGGQ